MSIKILAVGKKHEPWVADGIRRYLQRLRRPFDAEFVLLSPSSAAGEQARAEESAKILKKIRPVDHLVLLDERGTMLSSPGLEKHLAQCFLHSAPVVLAIGGAFGVDESLRQRANLVWSLSDLVFPHQLVRLMVAEQLYRAQEISSGSGYHHL